MSAWGLRLLYTHLVLMEGTVQNQELIRARIVRVALEVLLRGGPCGIRACAGGRSSDWRERHGSHEEQGLDHHHADAGLICCRLCDCVCEFVCEFVASTKRSNQRNFRERNIHRKCSEFQRRSHTSSKQL